MEPETERRLIEVAERIGKAQHERLHLMKDAKDQGASLRQIANLVGMSYVWVKNQLDADQETQP